MLVQPFGRDLNIFRVLNDEVDAKAILNVLSVARLFVFNGGTVDHCNSNIQLIREFTKHLST